MQISHKVTIPIDAPSFRTNSSSGSLSDPPSALRSETVSEAIGSWSIVLFLTLYAGTFSLILDGLPLVLEGALLPAMLGLSLLLIFADPELDIRVSLLAFAVVVWQLMSLAWSFDPIMSVFITRTEIAATLLCLVVAGSLSLERFRLVLLRTGVVIIVASLLALLALPASRSVSLKDQSPGLDPSTWRAMFPHKNSMGIWTGIATISVLSFARGRTRSWLIGGGVFLVLGSRSVTALLTLCIGVAAFVTVRSLFRRAANVSASIVALVALGTVGAVLVLENLSTVVGWFGKDPTLTGRTRIWSVAWGAVLERPVFGFGSAGFWYSTGEFRETIDRGVGFGVFQAHQGVIELLLLYGAVGLVLVVAVIVLLVRLAIRIGVRDPDVGAIVIAIVSMIVLSSLSEPMLSGAGLDLMLFLLAGLVAARTGPPTVRVARRRRL